MTRANKPRGIPALLPFFDLVLAEPLIELRRCVGGRPAVVPDALEGGEAHLCSSNLADGFHHLIRMPVEHSRVLGAMEGPDRNVDQFGSCLRVAPPADG